MNVAVHKTDFSTDIIPNVKEVRPGWRYDDIVIIDEDGDDLRYDNRDVTSIEIRP
jgi:hypothetical protein